ncbi:MAG: hypothetical protein D6737_07655 [Chloroflexi bacterium]|nr:MAG: hypothetical protein CUN54_06450 [Phototrophicales bacterium]RMF80552.1 MAG: hypothetical protein D6737_07655 [Chloroflexota bacterium]
MRNLVFFIEQLATGLYILIGVAVVIVGRNWLRARADYGATYYNFERNLARYRRANYATVMVLLLQFGLVVFGIQQIVAPTVRANTDTTQTIEEIVRDGEFNTPVPGSSGGAAPIDASGIDLNEDLLNLRPLQTPTLTPTPVGTLEPAPPVIGCQGGAQLQVPANGMVVHEPINVIGIANAEDFAFYRFELKGPATFENFAILRDFTSNVPEMAQLGQFVPSFYTPGLYEFRLVVFDVTNSVQAECTVNIRISEPIPTPTPIGQGT